MLALACGEEQAGPPVPVEVTTGSGRASRAIDAPGCDRYASPSGSSGASGGRADPIGSAQALADDLAPGEVGCLLKGTYDENVTIERGGSPGVPIQLRGAPGARAVVHGRISITDEADHVAIEQLILDGSAAPACDGDEDTCALLPSPSVRGDDVTFYGNEVTNRHRAICFNLGGRDEPARRVTIEANRIHECGRLPRTNYDHGIYVQSAEDTRILGNWIYDNADRGVKLSPDARRSLVRGNVIDANGVGLSLGGDDETASSENEVTANVISNSRERWNVETYFPGEMGEANVVRRNCLFAPGRDAPYDARGGFTGELEGVFAAGNLVADPEFSDAAEGDLTIGEDSGCREVVPGR